MAYYNIFSQELAIKYPTFGHPLWEPSPGELNPPVEVGDVGFIREGRFHRLFNCLLPADHPSHQNFGIPEHYEPLRLRATNHIDVGTLYPTTFHSTRVTISSDGLGAFAPGRTEPTAQRMSFSCHGGQGAILSLPVPARRQDTLAKGDFGRWIVRHIDMWFSFTLSLGLGITRMEDLVLVTGCHRARSSANIVFSEGHAEESVSFEAQVSDLDTNVRWIFPPQGVNGVAWNLGPSGSNLPEDQCIFIRGFRVTRFLGLLPRLQGASGQNQSPDEDEFEPKSQLMSVSTHSNDPLYTLLEYIGSQAPDCEMALVHDDDLMCIGNSKNGVMGHLTKATPRIWQVQCGDGTPVVKVATLTKYPFGTPGAQLPSPFPRNPYPRQTITVTVHAAHTLAKRLADYNPRDALIIKQIKSSVNILRVEHCADETAGDKRRKTPLHGASFIGHWEAALVLHKREADATSTAKDRSTPLHLVSRGPRAAIVAVGNVPPSATISILD